MRFCLLALALLMSTHFAFAQSDKAMLILMNKSIWGQDSTYILKLLPAWTAAGQDKITISFDRIVGEKSYATEAEAEVGKKVFDKILQYDRIEASVDKKPDGSFRLVIHGEQAEFLPQNLSYPVLISNLGKPEKEENAVYSYADGVFQFDGSKVIMRVIVNVSKLLGNPCPQGFNWDAGMQMCMPTKDQGFIDPQHPHIPRPKPFAKQ